MRRRLKPRFASWRAYSRPIPSLDPVTIAYEFLVALRSILLLDLSRREMMKWIVRGLMKIIVAYPMRHITESVVGKYGSIVGVL